MKGDILKVAVPSPLYSLFDYKRSDCCNSDNQQPGHRVVVNFGNRKLVGIIVDICAKSALAPERIKPILDAPDAHAAFTPAMVALLKWAAFYYCAPIGECFGTALPVLLRQPEHKAKTKKIEYCWQLNDSSYQPPAQARKQIRLIQLLRQHHAGLSGTVLRHQGFESRFLTALAEKNVLRKSISETPQPGMTTDAKEETRAHGSETSPPHSQTGEAPNLNPDQQAALDLISEDLGQFKPILLQGVTGSGKTEIYIRAIEQIINRGKQALLLVPEINLTPQTVSRFQQRFTGEIGVLHSRLTSRQRFDTWEKARRAEVQIVIGTRSAVFTPFPNLGLIIIDEEHDNSYKQMDGFRYSARDLAVKRAQLEDCSILLGSATPSLESYHNAKKGSYRHIRLMNRAGAGKYPASHFIDIKSRPLNCGLSQPLMLRIKQELEQENQVLIFQNRRGYAPTLMCYDCGQTINCHHCDARMTVHQSPLHLRCHHCDARQSAPSQCPHCQSRNLHALGAGTERLEQHLQQSFNQYPIYRMDSDTTRGKNSLENLLGKINSGGPGILIGTQMLAKGHDFHHVTLVAVVDADAIFFSSDFRALERGAQQLIQVAGRTGRGSKSGEVLIQTRQSEQTLLQEVAQGDYDRIAKQELHDRRLCQLPPYSRMLSIRAESKSSELNQSTLESIASSIDNLFDCSASSGQFLDSRPDQAGPLEAVLARKAGVYRSYLHYFSPNQACMTLILRHLPDILQHYRNHRIKLFADIDPQEYL